MFSVFQNIIIPGTDFAIQDAIIFGKKFRKDLSATFVEETKIIRDSAVYTTSDTFCKIN